MTGIRENMSAAEYHATKAVSATALKTLASSPTPAHARYRLDTPRESDAMLIGEALHCAVLEPERWVREWTKAPKHDRRTNAGKAAAAEFDARCAAESLRVLDPGDYNAVAEMAAAVEAHPEAAYTLKKATKRELSLFWTDTDTGLLCKARIDALAGYVLVDVKTTKNASAAKFSRDAFDYGYGVQLAHYAEGCIACGLRVDLWQIIAVENAPPYGVCVYELGDDWQREGASRRRQLLDEMAGYIKTGVWPAYPTDIVPLPYPAWAPTAELALTLGDETVAM